MSNEIVSAIIQAAGTVIAAIIGVGYLEKIIHKEIVPGFFSYSEPNHDLWEILRSATTEVVFCCCIWRSNAAKAQKAYRNSFAEGSND